MFYKTSNEVGLVLPGFDYPNKNSYIKWSDYLVDPFSATVFLDAVASFSSEKASTLM